MIELDPQTASAADFYDRHYAMANPIFLSPGMKLTLGSAAPPRHCRFCDKSEPEVTFRDEAHALPAAFGNTGLFSLYECDACNHLFGEGIENHLGAWSKPMRSLCRIRGRKGVPTIKKPGREKGWRLESDGSGFALEQYEDDPVFTVDEENKKLHLDLYRDTYVPVAALKGLVKIGLTLIPDEETGFFRDAFDWVRDKDHGRDFVSQFPIFRTVIPGPMPSDKICLILMRRRKTVTNVPYAFFVMAYGNEVLQVFIPSITQDAWINGRTLGLPPFPIPDLANAALYGKPKTGMEDLTGRTPVKGEKVRMTMGFGEVQITEPDGSGAE